MSKHIRIYSALAALLLCVCITPAMAKVPAELVYQPGKLKPVDSVLKVAVGEMAPDFTLPSVSGEDVQLSSFRGKKNVVLSFVPAAFTPICSDQWPGYNIAQELFEQSDAILLGITADNTPTQYAWTKQMSDGGVWFPVLSDFWPHGKVAQQYGILRPEGVTERAIFIIDKKGIIRYIDVHDINTRPDLGGIIRALQSVK
ncbi:peroxiredoxin [Maridesulfovibrio frigidus]|uniref:peroxiredoxin n=1 Tax=Maridesulfovibrio frigidus TaxID=340956 RepID=UPI0004E0BBF6|nr:peroxiredoxin [Maridesulfovibrio frigidus]